MTTPTELVNMALAHLGQARISDFSERSPAAEHCRRAYDHVRRLCLRDYDWNFAIRRATLTAAEAPPEFDWGYEYPLPSDCLRVISVNQRPGGTRLTDYAVEGRAILSNSADCRVRYIRDVTDPTLWDSMFSSYFCYRLAAAIAPSLRLDPAAGQQMEQMAAAIRDQAREADAVESEPRVTRLDQSEMIEEREGGRGQPWFSYGTPGGTAPGGTATWGSIGGTLTDQADLVAALAGKAAVSHTHSADQITSGTFSAARFAGTVTDTYVLALVDGVPTWSAPGGGTPGSGDVVGPSSATDNALARFNSTTGKLIQSSTVIVSDAGNVALDTITLSAAPATAITDRVLGYNSDEQALSVGIGGIVADIPMQEFVRVYNDSGTTLTKGQPVYVSGAQGNRTAVKLANASTEATSAGTIGLVAQTIAAGAVGLVQRAGPMRNLNTNGLTAGALLFLSETAGQVTQTPPTAPAHAVRIGWVERVSSTVGIILIKIDNGYELEELHDVLISAPQEGQILTYDSLNGVWVNSNNPALFVGGTPAAGYFVVGDSVDPSQGVWTSPSATRTALGLGSLATESTVSTTLIDAKAVTYDRMQDVGANSVLARVGTTTGSVSAVALAASQLLGRGATGNVAAITLASNLSMSGTTLNVQMASRASNASDVFTMGSDEVLRPVDKNANALVIWDDANAKLTYATLGSGLSFSSSTGELSITGGGGGIGGSTGTTDNAVLRSDGTGGSTLQASGLSIDDAVNSFSGLTGDAGTDIITAPGTAFANGDPVRFRSLTGGGGLNTTTNYFVRDVSGTTFRVATSVGGTAVNFTTTITAGVVVAGHFVQPFVGLAQNTSDANSSLVLVAQGTGALIFGPRPDGTATGGNARGIGAIDLQTSRSTATQVASGERSLLLGNESTASGPYAVAAGNGSVATGVYAIAIGQTCSATAESAFSCGKINTASADLGFSSGERALANRRGMFARAAGQFSAIGDAQVGQMVLRRSTTDATPTELTSDGGSPTGTAIATSNRFILLSNQAIMVDAYIVARSASGTDHGCYHRRCLIQRTGTTTALVGSVQTVGTDIESSGASAWDVTLAADDTNESLQILVTGAASTTIRWTCELQFREVILA